MVRREEAERFYVRRPRKKEKELLGRIAELNAILRRISSDIPGYLQRAARLLWERSGNIDEAFEISKHRLLALFFETTDFCNARCVMCGSKFMQRPRQIMSMEIYRKVVEEFAKINGHSIMLSAFGEPLLDPHLIERVSFASRLYVFRNIGFSTNGSLLTAEKYERLAEAGLKSLSISMDGFQKEICERVRVGLSFENLERNIENILKIHDALKRPININVSSFTSESPSCLSKSALYKQLVGAGIYPGLKWRVDNRGGLISDVSNGLLLMRPATHRGPCALLYDSSLLILPDGRVTPCHCRDLEGTLYVGEVQEHSLLKIWCGELLNSIRQEQWENHFRPPCGNCSAYVTLRAWFTRSLVRWIIAYHKRVPLGPQPSIERGAVKGKTLTIEEV